MAYSQQQKDNIFEIVFTEIINGRAVRNILKDEGMPPAVTFFDWLSKDEEKSKQYARAIELRAELKFESIEQDYLEEPQRDPDTGRIDTGWVQLQRLKIDAKKWELSKMHAKKFGDKVDVTTQGEKINQPQAIQIEIVKADEAKGNASISE
jgi:hypothetical protein